MEKQERRRTIQQNKCIHKMFSEVARELLNAGIERKTIVEDLDSFSVPIDDAFVKEIWRAIMFTQTGKQSTTEMTTSEIDKVYDTFNLFLGENYGIHIPFPSMESLYQQYMIEHETR